MRILLIFAGFFLVGWPTWQITHSSVIVAAPVAVRAVSPGLLLQVRLTFATAPTRCAVEYLGQPLAITPASALSFTGPWKASLLAEGADLFVSADWPAETPATAVRVEVLREDGTSLGDQTFWAEGDLAETVTVRNQP